MSDAPHRPLEALLPNPKLRFMDQCRQVMRFLHFSLRTEEAYLGWIRRFIIWSGKESSWSASPSALSVPLRETLWLFQQLGNIDSPGRRISVGGIVIPS